MKTEHDPNMAMNSVLQDRNCQELKWGEQNYGADSSDGVYPLVQRVDMPGRGRFGRLFPAYVRA